MPTETEELDDQTLFDDAVGNEQAEQPVNEPAAEPETVDDKPEPVEAKSEQDEPQPEAIDDDKIPQWRRAEMAEATRQAKKDADESKQQLANERAERARLQQELDALKKPAQPAQADDEPDPLIDPKAYRDHIKKELREEILNDRREASLQLAHKTYKGEFEEAYKLAGEKVDPALKAKMQASRDPGETLISWFREQKTAQEIGGDLTAYKQRLLDEALKDPGFRQKATDAWKAEAPAATQGNGRPRVSLPPSLNGASRANAAVKSGNDEVSDEQLFEDTTAT